MEITNISQLDRSTYQSQDYKPQDELLLNNLEINREFGLPEDKIELHIISPSGEILNSTYDFRNYTVKHTINNSSLYDTIELDPKQDLESFGYFLGQYNINYNFLRNLFLSSFSQRFFIKEISSDRTELRISSNNISYTDLGQSYLDFISNRNSRNFYSDFLINLGNNNLLIAVNVALDNVNTTLPSLYIKLYEPLPPQIELNTTLWVNEQISEPYSFRINTDFIAEEVSNTIPLRGPNINIELNEQVSTTTSYLNLSNLLSTSTTSSYQQLQSWLEEKSIEINIDYSDFSNFIHFSSITERLENFKYKLIQIQSLQNDLNNLNNLNPLTNNTFINVSKQDIQNKINSIIEKFDGYEYYVYYESGSNCWPKINNEKPYINQNVNSLESLTWFGSIDYTSQYYGGKILDANNYDINNKNYIWNNLPEYVKEDSQNSNLELFTSMLGQHYDYIWTYIKDITNLHVADNRLDYGISKDLVAEALKSFGIKLYTNSQNQNDIYASLLGLDSNGSFLPSTGSYQIDTYITSSQYTIPNNDITKETYKRIYHNLPYLLKTKGTRTGLRALINCFGIPETILRINEYGGLNKDNSDINNIYEKFNYSLLNGDLSIPLKPSYQQYTDTGFNDIYPDTLEFRFKLDSNNILPTQSLLESSNDYKVIKVDYITGSNANINFGLFDGNTYIYSPSIELPLYNDEWWNLNLSRETGSLRALNSGSNQTYTLTIGNKDDNGVNYLQSCSIFIEGSTQSQYNLIGWNTEDTILPGSQQVIQHPFSGSIQEFRYWIGSIPINNFKEHILNPISISYLNNTGSYNNLIFRLPLGSELDNNIISTLYSVHPSSTASFYDNITPYSYADINGNIEYNTNLEKYIINPPNIGTINEINDKISIIEPNLIPGDVLTPYISIQKAGNIRTNNDLDIVEISLSPQDSINEDIIAQLGQFNIDQYIGDPRLASLSYYPELTKLRNFYFQKYSNSQNIFDIIKLLSYFDNSLFKMIKDFVPAKTNLSTGLVIKSHILERNKQPRYEPVLEFNEYEGSINTAFITGSNGLDKELNTSYISETTYISGSILKLNNDKRELFNGELGGTTIKVYNQPLENIIYELNNLPLSSSQNIINNFSRLPFQPIYNNINNSITSLHRLNLDYSTNPNIPVNINYINEIYINGNNVNLYPFLTSETQNSNYTLARHIKPRYEGSKLIGAKYNIFTPGDISLGDDPVINYNSTRFVYFNEITEPISSGSVPTITFPGRVNAKIKYLIDSSSNVIELTQANKNLYDIQYIFNDTLANVSLNDIDKPTNQKLLDGLKPIYAGGFKYEPILQNYQTSANFNDWNSLNFEFDEPISITNPNPDSLDTASLALNNLSIGNPTLVNPIQYTPVLNQNANNLSVFLTSPIRYTVSRQNTSYNGEIRKRITGNVSVNIKVSPGGGFTSTVWSDSLTLSGSFPIPIERTSANTISSLNNFGWNAQDNIRRISLPVGFRANFYNSNNDTITTSVTGSRTFNSGDIPNFNNDNGVNSLEVLQLNSSASFSGTGTAFNIFSPSNPATFNTGSGTYPIENNNGLEIIVTFPIDGLIILPAGENNATIDLRTLSGSPATIGFSLNFSKTSTSPQIRFTTAPTSTIALNNTQIPYYLTSAPNTIYSTNILDNGFDSGSFENWFFERGNSVSTGSKFTYLTSSYDLSRYYFDYVNSPIANNNLTQILPTASINDPVKPLQDITEYFIPKKGDLIRFYNHESNKFPIESSFEREIINIFPPLGSNIGSGSNGIGSYQNRLVFEVSGEDIPNQACINIPSGSELGKITNFIFLSKIPDETNIVLTAKKNLGITSYGIILPEDINNELKEESGNIVKTLKSQNLI